MLIKEAEYLKTLLDSLNITENTILLNVGSQNKQYLKENPHINENIIIPILQSKATLINFDLLPGEGVDINGDIYDETVFQKLKDLKPDIILLFNILEHVSEIDKFANKIENIINNNGYIIFSGPYKYPKHFDPIDNMFRPEPIELNQLFKNCKLIKSKIIIDYKDIYYQTRSLKIFIKTFLRYLAPFYKYKKWKEVVLPRLKWLFKNFEAVIVLLQKK